MRKAIFTVHRAWTILLSLMTAGISIAEQVVPALQGVLPPVAYAVAVVVVALLPSVLERRGSRT